MGLSCATDCTAGTLRELAPSGPVFPALPSTATLGAPMTGTARTSLTGLVKPALVALCAVLIMNILAAASALAVHYAAA